MRRSDIDREFEFRKISESTNTTAGLTKEQERGGERVGSGGIWINFGIHPNLETCNNRERERKRERERERGSEGIIIAPWKEFLNPP